VVHGSDRSRNRDRAREKKEIHLKLSCFWCRGTSRSTGNHFGVKKGRGREGELERERESERMKKEEKK